MNSEPSPAPSWLAIQFLLNYGLTDGIWPYKVLGFTGTHPLIRKDIGERYQIGGVDNWMALQVMRTGDDISRIEKWMETPQGAQWVINQGTGNSDNHVLLLSSAWPVSRHCLGRTGVFPA